LPGLEKLDEALAPLLVDLDFLVLAALTALLLLDLAELLEADLDAGGAVMMLVALGVGEVVHCHRPSARTQDWPSAAVP